MADRIHPAPLEPLWIDHSPELPDSPRSSDSFFAPSKKPAAAPPGSYLIQVPKDQIYRLPPPANARLFEIYTRRGKASGRRPFCRCLCWTLLALLLLAAATAITGTALYLVYKPKAPKYSIQSLSFKSFNLSTASGPLSPEIDAAVRADNRNRHLGIYYRGGGDITVSYDGVALCDGVWPTFFQGRRNVTEFRTALTASGLVLTSSMQQALLTAEKEGKVPLNLNVGVPVRFKIGAVTTWSFTVKVRCEITVDKMTADAKVLSNSCTAKVKL